MSHPYNSKAKKLESTMSQEALAQFGENTIRIIERLRDEVLNLRDIVTKSLQEEKQDHPVRNQS